VPERNPVVLELGCAAAQAECHLAQIRRVGAALVTPISGLANVQETQFPHSDKINGFVSRKRCGAVALGRFPRAPGGGVHLAAASAAHTRQPYALIGLWSALLPIAETVVGRAPYRVSFAGPKEQSDGLFSEGRIARAIERHIGVARL